MSTTTPSIGDLLLGQTRGQILALLLGAPDESFFTRQIARQIATSVGTVQRELTRLADAGLIRRSALGSQVFYRANRDHPIFPELRALLAKMTASSIHRRRHFKVPRSGTAVEAPAFRPGK